MVTQRRTSTLLSLTGLALLAGASAVMAADPATPAEVPAADAPAATVSNADIDAMKSRLEALSAQIEALRSAADPQQRDDLLMAHRQALQEALVAVPCPRAMPGCMRARMPGMMSGMGMSGMGGTQGMGGMQGMPGMMSGMQGMSGMGGGMGGTQGMGGGMGAMQGMPGMSGRCPAMMAHGGMGCRCGMSSGPSPDAALLKSVVELMQQMLARLDAERAADGGAAQP